MISGITKGRRQRRLEKHIEVRVIGKYNGHSIKANQSVDLGIKAGYDQLADSVKLLQFLNNDVTIKAKVPDVKPFSLGTFRVQAVNISHDGESSIKFNSMADFTEVDNFSKLLGSDLVVLRVSADVELEQGEEEE